MSLSIRGAVAIVFAIAIVMLPSPMLGLLVVVASYAVLDAVILAMLASWAFAGGLHNWRWLALEAAAGVAFAIVAFTRGPALGVGLVYLLAIWALVTGILEIAAGSDTHEGRLHTAFVIGGGLSCAVAIALVAAAHLDRNVIAWLLAAYAVAAGVTLIATTRPRPTRPHATG